MILEQTLRACHRVYGERLSSLAVFGSVARSCMRVDSDIDVLLLVEPLPDGRMARMREFAAVETLVAASIAAAREDGINTALSPVFKTPHEMKQGSLLFLDMVDEAEILYDRDRLLRDYLDDFGLRLRSMGAKRIRKGGGYYWLLKPDLEPGETIEL